MVHLTVTKDAICYGNKESWDPITYLSIYKHSTETHILHSNFPTGERERGGGGAVSQKKKILSLIVLENLQ